MSKQVKIITVGAKRVGLGHFKRMISLSRFFLEQGFGVELELLPGSEIGQDLICDFPSKKIKSDLDLIVCDFHDDLFLSEDFQIKEKVPVVHLDYFGEKLIPDLNIILFDHGKKNIPGKKILKGIKYFMLRAEVANHAPPQELDYILVTLGGADILGQTESCLEQLTKLFKIPIIAVNGPLSNETGLFKQYKNVTRYTNPANYVDLLANCSLAICNSGSTMFEALFFKKKCWIAPQSFYEENLARFFVDKNWILGSGINLAPLKEKLTSFALNYDCPIGNLGPENIFKEVVKLLQEE